MTIEEGMLKNINTYKSIRTYTHPMKNIHETGFEQRLGCFNVIDPDTLHEQISFFDQVKYNRHKNDLGIHLCLLDNNPTLILMIIIIIFSYFVFTGKYRCLNLVQIYFHNINIYEECYKNILHLFIHLQS